MSLNIMIELFLNPQTELTHSFPSNSPSELQYESILSANCCYLIQTHRASFSADDLWKKLLCLCKMMSRLNVKRRGIAHFGVRHSCFVVKEGMGLAKPTLPLNALNEGQFFFPTKMVTVPPKISRTTLKWEKLLLNSFDYYVSAGRQGYI